MEIKKIYYCITCKAIKKDWQDPVSRTFPYTEKKRDMCPDCIEKAQNIFFGLRLGLGVSASGS